VIAASATSESVGAHRLLETLTLGMYGETRDAIREYLQNGFDALRAAIKDSLIEPDQALITVTMNDDSLTIRDNGIGLTSEVAVSTLTSIGASKKDYRQEAGFRGIGRLAGIVFCKTLTFTTKAAGEKLYTIVVFDAEGLRRDMSPAHGGHLPLDELLVKHVSGFQNQSDDETDHYFEVSLDGFVENPPIECTDPFLMASFIGQVAPVPYASDFPFRNLIMEESRKRTIRIDEIKVFVRAGDDVTEVFKPYGTKFTVVKDSVALDRCEFIEGKGNRWWGWIGHKIETGAYKDERSKGIRVRVRNIQIDAAHIIGQIFEKDIPTATSYGRFNDWFIGEIFVDPIYLVPNAHRDHFEDDQNWRSMRDELVEVCQRLGREAYEISRKNQHSLNVLGRDTRTLEIDGKRVFDGDFPEPDDVIEISNRANKIQRRVGRALRNADFEITSQLRSLENKLIDVKTKAVRKLGITQLQDIDEIREQAENDLMSELMKLFKKRLDSRCYGKALKAAEELLGRSDF
jgi:hypothetical protein